MKLRTRINGIYENIKKGFKNYPITIIALIVLYILSISVLEDILLDDQLLRKIILSLILFIPISISIKESKDIYKYNKYIEYILYIFSITAIFLYYNHIYENMIEFDYIRFVGLNLFFYLVYFYIKKIDFENYSKYIIKIFGDIFLSGIFSFILLLGLIFTVFTVNTLFSLDFKFNIYLYMFLFVFILFFPILSLSRFSEEKNYDNYNYPKAFKNLLYYIVIPLTIIYIAILYIYFLKILFTRIFPEGIVSHLVLWYSIILIALFFFIKPLENENKFIGLYRKLMPIILIPIIIMMFVSMGIRINEYGITENRYFVIIMGVWVLLADLYIMIRKNYNTRILPISLSIIILISIISPINAFKISKTSQRNRFISIMKKNNMLVDNTIVPNGDISNDDKINISSLVDYFVSRDNEELIFLDKEYQYINMNDDFGFSYTSYYDYYNDNYKYIYMEEELLTDIKDYDYILNIKDPNTTLNLEEIDFNISIFGNTLELAKDNKLLYSTNITDIITDKIKNINGKATREQLTIVDENENIKYMMIMKYINLDNNKIVGLEFDFLYKIKN